MQGLGPEVKRAMQTNRRLLKKSRNVIERNDAGDAASIKFLVFLRPRLLLFARKDGNGGFFSGLLKLRPARDARHFVRYGEPELFCSHRLLVSPKPSVPPPVPFLVKFISIFW